MAFPYRISFSKEPSDVHLTGELGSNWGSRMYGEYQNDSTLPDDDPSYPALEYLHHYAALPANRPVGYPHLINTDKYTEYIQLQNLRIADAVVTVLYKWEPEALATFLDDDLEDIRFQVQDHRQDPHKFYVQRQGKRVEAGQILTDYNQRN